MCSLVAPRGGRVVPGEPEEVVALVEREVQPLRDRRDHLLRGLRPALPLEPRVVVGRHVAERGDLLAPQPAGPAARPARQADVLGLQRLASATEERPPARLDRSPRASSCVAASFLPLRGRDAATDRRSPSPRPRPASGGSGGPGCRPTVRRRDRGRHRIDHQECTHATQAHRHHRPRPVRQARRRHRRERRHRTRHRHPTRRGRRRSDHARAQPRARARRRSPDPPRGAGREGLAARPRPVLAGLGRRPRRRPCSARAGRSTS